MPQPMDSSQLSVVLARFSLKLMPPMIFLACKHWQGGPADAQSLVPQSVPEPTRDSARRMPSKSPLSTRSWAEHQQLCVMEAVIVGRRFARPPFVELVHSSAVSTAIV